MTRKTLVYVLVLGVFGACFVFAAFEVWRGTLHAQLADRMPGTVHDGHGGDRYQACGATYDSDDGSVRGLHVTVEGACPYRKPEHGGLVRAIDTAGVTGPSSSDTVYTDGVNPTLVGYYVLCLVLTLCSLITAGPVLLLVLLGTANRLAGRRGV